MTLYAKSKKIKFGVFKGFHKTIIKNQKGVIKVVVPPDRTQPKKTHKKIRINQIYYNLKFI